MDFTDNDQVRIIDITRDRPVSEVGGKTTIHCRKGYKHDPTISQLKQRLIEVFGEQIVSNVCFKR